MIEKTHAAAECSTYDSAKINDETELGYITN